MDLNQNNPFIYIWVNVGIVGLILTWYAYGYRAAIIDKAVGRSLHQGQAITGAGLFIFIPFTLSIGWLRPEFLPVWAIFMMSVIGFIDDRFDVSFKLRLIIQTSLIALCMYYFGFRINLLGVFLLLASLWWVNLFNFMDGANGMAGFHSWVILGFYSCVAMATTPYDYLAIYAMALISLYLVFNVVLKRLFMGDSGSLPLALLLVVLAFMSLKKGDINYLQVALLHAVFITDATLTLLFRLAHGENITQAHASHLYQRLIKVGHTHVWVSFVYAFVTVILCVVVWLIKDLNQWYQLFITVTLYLLLIIIFMKFLTKGR